jgi:hypothetical protein
MTRDEIAQMMQDSSGMDLGTEAHFQRFAALVAAAERDRACRIVTGLCISDNNAREINDAIRAKAQE